MQNVIGIYSNGTALPEWKITKTRFFDETGVVIGQWGAGHYQHLDTDCDTVRPVGPIYKTKLEILADHENYLRNIGGWLR